MPGSERTPTDVRHAVPRRRAQLWFARSPPHPAPLCPALYSLGRGSISLGYLDRIGRPSDRTLYEICCVLRGSDEGRTADGVERVGAGTTLLAGPNHRVSHLPTTISSGELSWLCLQFDIADGGEASSDGPNFAAMRRHDSHIIPTPTLLPPLIDRLLDEHKRADELSAWAAEAVLRCVMAEVLRAAERGQPALLYPNAAPSNTIAAAIELIDERLAEPLRIATLAAAVRLSPAQFHVRFLDETGFTPADFWSRRRLAKAQELLADPQLSITDIALTLGFSTSQYFATFFRRFTGASPRDYRRRLSVS